jgi:type IV pilus assembly protein PilQ
MYTFSNLGKAGHLKRHLPMQLFLMFSLLWASGASAASNTLKDIKFSTMPGDKVQITLSLTGPASAPQSFTTDKPARISLDFDDTASELTQKSYNIGIGKAKSVAAIAADSKTRVVINLVKTTAYQTKVQGNDVIITLDSGNSGPESSAGNTYSSESSAPASADGGLQITDIDFRRGDGGEGRIIVSLTDPSAIVDIKQQSGSVVLDFVDTALPENLQRRLDVTDFSTPVKFIDTTPSGDGTKMIITPVGDYEHLAYQANDQFVVEFKPVTKEEKEADKKKRFQYTGERLSLNFQDIEVRAVLQLLADFTDLNMVTSDSVGGNLTLRLKNVPWDQALDIILKAKGLAMRQTGNVILVAPTEEIAAREKLELEASVQIEELAPLRSEFMQINYAKASDLAELIKSQENNLLSDRGSVTIDERTNTLLVQDIDSRLLDVQRLVDRLDVEVRQVLIEARIVNASVDFSKELGVRFGAATASTDVEGGRTLIVGGGKTGVLDSSSISGGPFISEAGSTNENLLVDLAAASDGNGAIQFVLGKIGSHILELELSAAQQDKLVEDIGSPKVVTLDKHEALVANGFEIPFQEASSSGATTTSFKKAELSLKVTPSITPDDRVIMDLTVQNDAPVDAGANNGAALSTQEVTTSVLVDNGETIVLGGVYVLNNQDTVDAVPFFSDIPYVGFLFKRTKETNTKKELLIFITPKILKSTLAVN